MHSRPFHYWAWLERAAAITRSLEAAHAGWEVRLAMNEALASRAVARHDPGAKRSPQQGHGLRAASLAVFAQEEIRSIYGVPNVAILEGFQHERWPEHRLDAHARLLRERLAGFEPDVIVTWTPSAPLRRAFPGALVLHTEMGLFSREPYPSHAFLDPAGMLDRSLLATHAEDIRSLDMQPGDAALLAALRARLRERHEATTPFTGFERRLRARFRSLALLPLQFGGEIAFDASGPFRNQGELLMHALEQLPAGVGLIVAQHGTGLWVGDRIDEETQAYLTGRYPQAVFVPPSVTPNAGQALVPHVDSVLTVSSSIGMQALYWKRRLVSLGSGALRAWADGHTVAALAGDSAPREQDGALAWLLRHYWVRDAKLLHDGAWLNANLRRMAQTWHSGVRGLAWHQEAEPVDLLTLGLVSEIPPAPPRVGVAEGLLVNGALAMGAVAAPAGWELLPGSGSRVAACPVAAGPAEAAVRITHEAPGSAPTLFLQRIDNIGALAGAFVTVRLRARGAAGETLGAYFFQQTGSGGSPGRGTQTQAFALDETWREHAYTTTLSDLDGMRLGAGHHTELVLVLFPGEPGGWIELADIRLEPGDVLDAEYAAAA